VDIKNPIPTVACYNADKEASQAGEEIAFDASCSSTDADSYAWDFGDSTKATGVKATHMYEKAGEYTVSLKVVGGGPAETTKTITVK
jgi:PKD repeat protein